MRSGLAVFGATVGELVPLGPQANRRTVEPSIARRAALRFVGAQQLIERKLPNLLGCRYRLNAAPLTKQQFPRARPLHLLAPRQ